jgi:hypothetical protein
VSDVDEGPTVKIELVSPNAEIVALVGSEIFVCFFARSPKAPASAASRVAASVQPASYRSIAGDSLREVSG